MLRILAVASGGAIGAVARFGLAELFIAKGVVRFPWATLITNLTGCFVLGVLAGMALEGNLPKGAKDFATTGVLGAFTTYSTFNLETLQLLQAPGRTGQGIFYAAVTLAGGLLAAWLGLLLPRLLT